MARTSASLMDFEHTSNARAQGDPELKIVGV